VVFKVQSYRTNVADVDANGGATRQLATFQSETPSYHPTKPLLSFTYGTWRRVLDDGKYPDIAQEIGTIDLSQNLPASKPLNVIAQSESEDQAMAWSPNGKWIAFHSHREMSDDVWLRPADGSQPDKRITFLGRGAEVGWPRWSPDGTQVLLDGANRASGRSVIYRIGVDQDTGAITSDIRMRRAEGIDDADITHAEWLGNDAVVALLKEAPAPSAACESCAGRHAIVTMNLTGGAPRVIYRFATEHDFSGLGVSRDGKYLAFAAPASDGFYQVFKIATEGGTPVQLTNDRSNKTQPAFSPDGSRVAFTVWSYDAAFWSFNAR
jgi:dipeptidyl aminopeptidase/acylaminoacyl peptidase